jgi:hypothetical protein
MSQIQQANLNALNNQPKPAEKAKNSFNTTIRKLPRLSNCDADFDRDVEVQSSKLVLGRVNKP